MAEQCQSSQSQGRQSRRISIMQLFHELRQAFPTVPDEVVSQCIRQNAHNKEACERVLRREVQTHMVHTYPAALMTGPGHMAAVPGHHQDPAKRPALSPKPQRPPVVPPQRPPRPGVPTPHQHQSEDLPARVRDLSLLIPPAGGYDPTSPPIPRRSSSPSTPARRPSPSPASTSPTPPRALSAGASPSIPSPGAGNPFLPRPFGASDGQTPPPTTANAFSSGDNVTVLDVSVSQQLVQQQQPRVTTSVQVQPAPHFSPVVPPRSYTSVNLTLRPPSSEPQPPIDIHSAGSSLTYSTSSYDPRQGYQSQLQIRIGPGGLGSVSAQRTRAPVPPLPPVPPPRPPQPAAVAPLLSVPDEVQDGVLDVHSRLVALGAVTLRPDTREHLVRQLERRALLETELLKESNKLRVMQKEVAEMERDLEERTAHPRPRLRPALPVIQKVQRLKTEIQQLQNECTRLASEVDAKTPVTLPLGETDEEFYKNIYTGPSGSLWPRIPQSTPRRPEESGSESGWTCEVCTFHNHYLLEACETCDMPRIRIGRAATQDIHIRVTHHNFPTRRSLHGWVD